MKVLENIKNNRILFILFVLILVCILILITRLTQSYFQAQVDDTHVIDADIEADLVDNLEFIEGAPLSLTVNPTTLPQNGTNLTSTSKPKARLTTSSTTSVTYNYYVYFKITNNTFEYTNGSTPEIILTIKNPSNTTITSISGLTYVTQNGVSGFDVTEYNGIIPIASNYAISGTSSTSPITQEWTFTLTFLNLTTDQNANMDKTLNTDIIFKKDEYRPLLAYEVIDAWVSNNDDSIVIKHDGTILDGSNNVLDAEDNSYRYTGGDYDVTQTAINAGYSYVNTYNGNTTGGVIGVNCNGTNQYVGYQNSACSTKYYYLLYDRNVTQYATYDAALAKAITDGYLVARNLNNYVCFGYDTSVLANATTCPEQNLYRIIGAFDDDEDGYYEVKLIKYDAATTTEIGTQAIGLYSNTTSTSNYSGYKGFASSIQSFTMIFPSSTDVFNSYYYELFLKQNNNGNHWTSMIQPSKWYTCSVGLTSNYKTTYTSERCNTVVVNNVELMYVSDFAYASPKNYWNYTLNDSGNATLNSNNWLYSGFPEWSISRYYTTNPRIDMSAIVVSIINDYSYSYDYKAIDYSSGVRQSFYLKHLTEIVSGTGSKADPYYIDLPS